MACQEKVHPWPFIGCISYIDTCNSSFSTRYEACSCQQVIATAKPAHHVQNKTQEVKKKSLCFSTGFTNPIANMHRLCSDMRTAYKMVVEYTLANWKFDSKHLLLQIEKKSNYFRTRSATNCTFVCLGLVVRALACQITKRTSVMEKYRRCML